MKGLVVVMTLTLNQLCWLQGRQGRPPGPFFSTHNAVAAQSPQAPIYTSKAPSAGIRQQFSSPGGKRSRRSPGARVSKGVGGEDKGLKRHPQPANRKKESEFRDSLTTTSGGVKSHACWPRIRPTGSRSAAAAAAKVSCSRSPSSRFQAAASGRGPWGSPAGCVVLALEADHFLSGVQS